MQTLTEKLIQAKLGERVIGQAQVARLLEGSPQRRYNLVNRALKAGELVRLRRGIYMLSPMLTGKMPHPFVIAQALAPGSYVSMETALAWHGLIPEAVHVTLSVVPGRRSLDVRHEIAGMYQFVPMALRRGCFLEGVDRQQFGDQYALVADPARAMADIVCDRGMTPAEMPVFLASMRIDIDDMEPIGPDVWRRLTETYQHSRMRQCIQALETGLRR